MLLGSKRNAVGQYPCCTLQERRIDAQNIESVI